VRAARRAIVCAVAFLGLAACGFDDQTNQQYQAAVGANHRGAIDVLDALFVLNEDGSATLSATVINHTSSRLDYNSLTAQDHSGADLLIRSFGRAKLRQEESVRLGRASSVEARLGPGVQAGQYVNATLDFTYFAGEGLYSRDVTLLVPVVARTVTYDSVAGNNPNTSIRVQGGKIVVVPGQKKAYVDGNVISTVDDVAYEVPTAVDSRGTTVKYRHQTATGGPYGLVADKSTVVPIGSPPYTEGEGDADYFDAKDVTIGEKITVTIPFQSGDVKATFTVVAG
jgi:hypothetical protein